MKIRRLVAAMLPLICITPAQAQNEAVLVEARTLAGVWKVTYPIGWGNGGWGSPVDHFCRIEENGAATYVTCLGAGIDSGRGLVSIKDGRLRLSWAKDPGRASMEGTLHSTTHFTATYSAAAGSGRVAATEISTGHKLTLREGAPDHGEKAQLMQTLLEQSAAGDISVPINRNSISRNYGALMRSSELKPLGKILVIVNLGLSPKFHYFNGGSVRRLGNFPIYGIEFEHGERICALNQADSGIVDYFHCA